jgi:hypothetical protein
VERRDSEALQELIGRFRELNVLDIRSDSACVRRAIVAAIPALLASLVLHWKGIASQVEGTRGHANGLAARRDLGFEDGWHDSHQRGALQSDRVPMGAMTPVLSDRENQHCAVVSSTKWTMK